MPIPFTRKAAVRFSEPGTHAAGGGPNESTSSHSHGAESLAMGACGAPDPLYLYRVKFVGTLLVVHHRIEKVLVVLVLDR